MSLALLACGGAIALLNFGLAFLRHPWLRARGVPRERIRFVSGIPLLGTLLLAVALLLGLETRAAWLAAWVLLLLDTGGPHWFAGSLLYQALRERARQAP